MKRLLRESEDLLEFDIQVDQFHNNEIQKGHDYLMDRMHQEDVRDRDDELQYLSSWVGHTSIGSPCVCHGLY